MLQDLFAVLELLLGLTQPLATLFQLRQFEGADLIGVEQALLLTSECCMLALEPFEFALGVSQLRAILLLLLPEVPNKELWLLQESTQMIPDHWFNVRLADAAEVAALLWRFDTAAFGTLIAPAGDPGVAAQAASTVATDEQPL